MPRRHKEGLLPFKVVPTEEPLVARSGLLLPYELARALKLPMVIDKELPQPGSGRGYKPSQFVMDWLRKMGKDSKGLAGPGKVNHYLVKQILSRDNRSSYTLDVDATNRIGERRG